MTETWYEGYVLPWLFDWTCELPVPMYERTLFTLQACGRVLEVGLSAEKLSAADASFDTVVSPVPHPRPRGRAARNAPGAEAWRQTAVFRARACARPRRGSVANPFAAVLEALGRGCHQDRDMPDLLAEAGFASYVQARHLCGPRVVSFHYWGEAVAA